MTTEINASAIDSVGPYAEEQLKLLCAKHALNNLLQEEKIGYYPKINSELVKPTGPIPAKGLLRKGKEAKKGAHLFDNNIQLNLWKYCEVLDNEQEAQTGEPVSEPACVGSDRDKLSFDRIPSVIEKLGYKQDFSYATKPGFWAEFKNNLQDINLLGVIINKGAWHYTAISKFVKGCTRWERNTTRRLVSKEGYTFLDSYPKIFTTCKNLDNMIKYIKAKQDVYAVIYVYDDERAYPSVTALRRRALDPASAHPTNFEMRAERNASVLSLAPYSNSRAQVVMNYGRPVTRSSKLPIASTVAKSTAKINMAQLARNRAARSAASKKGGRRTRRNQTPNILNIKNTNFCY